MATYRAASAQIMGLSSYISVSNLQTCENIWLTINQTKLESFDDKKDDYDKNMVMVKQTPKCADKKDRKNSYILQPTDSTEGCVLLHLRVIHLTVIASAILNA